MGIGAEKIRWPRGLCFWRRSSCWPTICTFCLPYGPGILHAASLIYLFKANETIPPRPDRQAIAPGRQTERKDHETEAAARETNSQAANVRNGKGQRPWRAGTNDGVPRGAAKPKRSPKGRSAAAGARPAPWELRLTLRHAGPR